MNRFASSASSDSEDALATKSGGNTGQRGSIGANLSMGTLATVMTAASKFRSPAPSMTVRARRRREEAVRRLVADVQSLRSTTGILTRSGGSSSTDQDMAVQAETHDWLVASTVATALERGLDRDLHAELVQETKDNAGRIGQVCHDHADVFLASVAQVAALGEPSADLADGLQLAQEELKQRTAGPMHTAAVTWELARAAHARALTLHVMVGACQKVAIHLERARKQAAAGRPRSALEAVDLARTALTTPMESLFYGAHMDLDLWKAATSSSSLSKNNKALTGGGGTGEESKVDITNVASPTSKKLVNLEETPFGKRAIVMLPKIENEVLMSARRNLNRWFLSLRSGGEGAKAGRAVLRQCAYSVAVGPGNLALGGHLPPSYIWRAKTADNLLSRVKQSGKVARAVRLGYWFDRDAPKEAERLETVSQPGISRRAEAFAAAFGWYRCWDSNSELLVDPAEFAIDGMDASGRSNFGLTGSRHGLSRSGHGLAGSRHGLRGSRHGGSERKGRSLGFRATTSSRSQAFQEITSGLTGAAAVHKSMMGTLGKSKWSELMNPDALLETSPSRTEEDEIFASLPESVHPVRRAELAFNLLGRFDEFVSYYEQNRFGEMKIGGDPKDDKGEKRSALSSLTGDDVGVGTDRIFFAKTFAHLCASVIGFCAVEAALELGNFADEDGDFATPANPPSLQRNSTTGAGSVGKVSVGAMSASHFRESSERYERLLITELGSVFRSRAPRANLCELVRASTLLGTFRAALKVVHPSSSSRRHDKDLLALDIDVLMVALKIIQEEQLKATMAIVMSDQKIPMLVGESFAAGDFGNNKNVPGVPDPEEIELPFGLNQMKQSPHKADLDFQENSRTAFNRAPLDEAFTFSASVPVVLRSIHARVITCAFLAMTQEELGNKFPSKKGVGTGASGYVLDCLEECVNVAAVGMKDSDNVVDEGSVEKAVQVMANISALQHCLPRLFGTVVRGMCHVGLLRADQIEEVMEYAEKTLRGADKSCDAQVGSTYSLVYEICRNKIDSHINIALEGFQWVAKSARDMPNAYCEGLIGYLKSVFASLGPMDDGSRAGLHFSCCGHVSERLVKLLSGKPGDTTMMDESGIPPITRIDAFGIKNMALDCSELERFADSTGIPQLRDCFNELRVLTSCMLDKELPILLLPENAGARRKKYPILSMDKVLNILEKYVGTGLQDKLMGNAGRNSDFLFIDKKEVTQLIKIVKQQVIR